MLFIPLLLVFASFYLLYAVSKRSNFSANKFVLAVKAQERKMRIVALALLLFSWAFFVAYLGIGAGTFYMLSSVMTLYASLVLFYPLYAFIKNK